MLGDKLLGTEVAQPAMRPVVVVMDPEVLQDDLSCPDVEQDFTVEAFISQSAALVIV